MKKKEDAKKRRTLIVRISGAIYDDVIHEMMVLVQCIELNDTVKITLSLSLHTASVYIDMCVCFNIWFCVYVFMRSRIILCYTWICFLCVYAYAFKCF